MKMIVKGVITRHVRSSNVVEFSVDSTESEFEGYKFPISQEMFFEVYPEKKADEILIQGQVLTPQTNRGELFETAFKMRERDEVTVEMVETDDGKHLVTAIYHKPNRGKDAVEHFEDLKELVAKNRAKNPRMFF